jgi:hypothetical protein
LNADVLEKQPKQKIFIQQDTTFKEIKTKLVRILNQANPNYNLTYDKIRLWKSNMSYSNPKEIADFFRKRNIGGPQTEIKTNDTQTPEIEENTGFDFPGMQFECMIDKTFKEIDRTQSFSFRYDLIVVEISTAESPFIFKYNTNPGAFGKCESCY